MTANPSTLDRVHIVDLQTRCIIGLSDEERRERQDVVVNVTLSADLRQACASDDIADAVDYKQVKKRIIAILEDSSFHLIERLADAIARTCFEDRRVAAVQVHVAKPGALRFARTVAVEITRERSDYVR